VHIYGKSINNAIKLLFSNPIEFSHKLYNWLYAYTLPRTLPDKPFTCKINGIYFEFDKSLGACMHNMYAATYEPHILSTLNHFLKPGDTFIDVGANIGYISALALSLVGKKGQVHSFEPVPEFFTRLEKLSLMNKKHKLFPNNFALGAKKDTAEVKVSNDGNIGWNTMVPGLMSEKESQKYTIDVPVLRLDEYIKDKNIKGISLIKIDTEGFEFPVLKGLSNFLDKNLEKPPILCEISPSGYSSLGTSLEALEEYMSDFNYKAFNVHCINEPIDIKKLTDTTDILFLCK
jgi:FkbM family methyltransferase